MDPAAACCNLSPLSLPRTLCLALVEHATGRHRTYATGQFSRYIWRAQAGSVLFLEAPSADGHPSWTFCKWMA
jgi:hypothetical protein